MSKDPFYRRSYVSEYDFEYCKFLGCTSGGEEDDMFADLEFLCERTDPETNLRNVTHIRIGSDENAEQIEVQGMYLDNSFLRCVDTLSINMSDNPGKHIRTCSIILNAYSITLTEFEKRLQVAVVNHVTNNVLYTSYKPNNIYGSIKYYMDSCTSDNQIEDFVIQMGNL